MCEIKNEVLNPLLVKYRLGRKLAEALIKEMSDRFIKTKASGKRISFAQIQTEVLRLHGSELRHGNDFINAAEFISTYFRQLQVLRKKKAAQEKEDAKKEAEQILPPPYQLKLVEDQFEISFDDIRFRNGEEEYTQLINEHESKIPHKK